MNLSWDELLDATERAQARLEATLSGLTDALAREPSLLPGWSRGHVVTHLGRNADAMNRLASGVLTGIPGEFYPGGPDARNAAIAEGADRPAALLVADLEFAAGRLLQSLRRIGDLANTPVRWRKPITAADLPWMRWNEVEIHHVDLDLGYAPQDWPSDYVREALATELPKLAGAAPELAVPKLPPAELLAWLVGRQQHDGLPGPPPWPF